MAKKYGLVIRSKKHGIDLLNTSQRIGRISGVHVFDIPFNQVKTVSFSHTELLKYGKVFAWFGSDFMNGLAGELELKIVNGVINIHFKNVYVNNLVGDYTKKLTLYYGVY